MLFDKAHIAGTARITKDGYFVADALVARADNVQDYRASELGLTDRDPTETVRVFRPAAEVFHKDALASLAHRPITLDHPADPVKAGNWKALAVGDVGDEVLRDGEFVRVPIKIMDAAAIDSVRTNRREFSLGYTAEIVAETGVHDGQSYDFTAKTFRYNHLAAVHRARGGESLRIIDERTTPSSGEPSMKIKIGDAEVDATNGEAVRIAVDTLNKKLSDGASALADAQSQVATLTTDAATKDAEIATLKQQVSDSAITPAKLRDAAKAYAGICDKAKALGVTFAEDADGDAIMAAVVNAKLGDAAKDWTADQIAVSFATLTKDAKPADPVRDAFKGPIVNVGDAAAVEDAAYQRMVDRLSGKKTA